MKRKRFPKLMMSGWWSRDLSLQGHLQTLHFWSSFFLLEKRNTNGNRNRNKKSIKGHDRRQELLCDGELVWNRMPMSSSFRFIFLLAISFVTEINNEKAKRI